MWIITISQTCLARVLRCCKSDQVLELHYQWQEEMLKQEKYKYKTNKYDLKCESLEFNSALYNLKTEFNT